MYSFLELRKAKKMNINTPCIKLAVLGNTATQLLSVAIEGNAKLEGVNLTVFDADYNQIELQLMDKKSETYRFKPDYILLYLSTDKLYEDFLDKSGEQKRNFAEDITAKLENYWNMIEMNCGAKILQCNFTEINDMGFGNYSLKTDVSFTFQIRKLNYILQEKLVGRARIYPIDLLQLQVLLGRDGWHNSALYYDTKIACDMNALPYFSKSVTDVIKAISGQIRKCVILDLDNTIWGGTIGDDGLSGIEIGELGKGHVFAVFQKWLRELKERGIILAVCSKNDEKIAMEPFEKHEEMILRLSDISVFVANWEDKASNIKYIRDILNIGFDSMVFIDDNVFERNLVRELLPEVTVPELPEDPACYLDFICSENLFETASFSDEDKHRTDQYRAEAERRKLMDGTSSVDEYLKGLDMTGTIEPFEPMKYPRIAQLTQRSNQFNLRTIRYSEDKIADIASDPNYITAYCTLKDRFGDHGLVLVLILQKQNSETVFIDTWLMSCRVLKRGMEEFIMNCLVEIVKEKGFRKIKGEYIPTAKNHIVSELYPRLGFFKDNEGYYSLNVDEYKENSTFIRRK